MFNRLFGLAARRDTAVIDALYGEIVAAARQPAFYADLDVPDTPLGRFEMLSLHVFMFLHRVRGEAAPLPDIAQELVDEFFKDVDHSIRELGISDTGVPKRMKKLSRMFYGRVASYGEALDANDGAALAAALARNVRPDVAWPHAEELAVRMFALRESLAAQTPASFSSGHLSMVSPSTEAAA
ncbi:MAG TPA: ubiquinol-cytochrome C chaperone family protein [Rhizobiaceae bacterium]|nr:ubiquinol-cytochrome C chaperone family protein [Rhizobiaceae bacterium]